MPGRDRATGDCIVSDMEVDRGVWRLVLETSGRVGRVALAQGERITWQASLDAAQKHARDLALSVYRLMREVEISPREVGEVIVSLGPGSYTGLRVGVMSAKAFAYAVGSRLIAVPTFEAIAELAPEDCQQVGIIADALQGQVYRQRYMRMNQHWQPAEPIAIRPLSELRDWLRESGLILGPGVKLLEREEFAGTMYQPWAEGALRPESLLQAAQRREPLSREQLFSLEPLYLRGSSAEEKLKRSEQG